MAVHCVGAELILGDPKFVSGAKLILDETNGPSRWEFYFLWHPIGLVDVKFIFLMARIGSLGAKLILEGIQYSFYYIAP